MQVGKSEALHKCAKPGCGQFFENEKWRDDHQERCGGIVQDGGSDGDQVETDLEDEELRKRPLSPSGAPAEEAKKPRIDPPDVLIPQLMALQSSIPQLESR